jgi:hypothetical protein
MTRFSLPLTQLIHESLSIIMTFCFSRVAIERLIESKFLGEWKYLRKGLFDVSEKWVEKACLELAMFLRLLDDEENMSGYLREIGSKVNFGRVVLKEESDRELVLRDVVNKIIHASALQWDLTTDDKPILICISRDQEKWQRAEIDIVSLLDSVGNSCIEYMLAI